jgi:hypothetical protein
MSTNVNAETYKTVRTVLLIAYMSEHPGRTPTADEFDTWLLSQRDCWPPLQTILERHAHDDGYIKSAMASSRAWVEFWEFSEKEMSNDVL